MIRNRVHVDLLNLPSDPSLRNRISDFDPNDQDIVRRAYLQKGPCQPSLLVFPQTIIGEKARRFNPNWFSQFGSWLEYSVKEDSVFCLKCYLFRPESVNRNMSEVFITGGYKN